MAGNSVDYIIKLVADESDLRKKLSSGDLLDKKEISKVKDLLVKVLDSANREAKNLGKTLQSGLDVDTAHLQDTLDFIQGIFKGLEKTRNPMEDWTKTGTTVYKAFDKMQTSVAVLAQNIGNLQTNVNNLTSSFADFKQSYQSFKPTQFAGINTEIKQIEQGAQKAISIMAKMEKATLNTGGLEKQKQNLLKLYDELSGKLLPDFSSFSVDDLLAEVEKLDKKWDEIDQKANYGAYTEEQTRAVGVLMAQLVEIDRLLPKNKKFLVPIELSGETFGASVKDYKEDIQDIIESVRQSLKKLQEDIDGTLGKSFAQTISEQISDIQLKLSLPTEQDFVNQINDYIAAINSKPLEPIRVAIDDAANVIKDKSKQKHKDKPASEDVNTDQLVEKTSQRFDRVTQVIKDKQEQILKHTNDWRQDMIKAMKIAASDLEFEFGWDKKIEGGAQVLKEAIQTYFDMPGNELNIHINHKALSEEIQTAFEEGGVAVNASGTATIGNLDDLVSALSTVLLGTSTQNTRTQAPKQSQTARNDEVVEKTQATQVTKQYVTQLDASSDSVKALVERLKDFANVLYGSKRLSAGAKAIGDLFVSKGIDLQGLYQNKLTNEQVAQQLTDAFLTQDKMGYATGSGIVDDLWSAIKKNKINSKTKNGAVIERLPGAFAQLLSAYGIIQESATEWSDRHDRLDVAQRNISAGRSLGLLNRARYPFKPNTTRRKINVDGGIWDIGNDFGNVITNLQQEKQNVIAQLTKDEEELRKIVAQAKMSKGDKASQYQKDYRAAKEIATEISTQRKQAEAELHDAEKAFKTSSTTESKEQALSVYKVAQTKLQGLLQQEKEAQDLERETLGTWQTVKIKVPNLRKAIEKREQLLAGFEALEEMGIQRATLGDNPTEEAMAKFKEAGLEFYQKSQALFTYLNDKFKFKGAVAINGGNELIPITKPQDILDNIPENARITYVESYGDHSNTPIGSGLVGSSQHKLANYRKANSQEGRMIAGGAAGHLSPKKIATDIINEVIDYNKFHALEAPKDVDLSGEPERQKLQAIDADISAQQKRLSELDVEIAQKEQEITSLLEEDKKYSDKRKQNAQNAVDNQAKIVEKAVLKQQEIDSQIKNIEEEIAQVTSTRDRIQQEITNLSDVDVNREKNQVKSQIKNLEGLEPYWQQQVTKIKNEYDLVKSTFDYADTRVSKRQSELAQAQESGEQSSIDAAKVEWEQAIKERTQAQAQFNQITQQLNDANNALSSNISQRSNLQDKLDNITIETVRADKQAKLDDSNAKLQVLDSTLNALLVRQQQADHSYSLVADELEQLKQQGPYALPRRIEQAQRDKDTLVLQKQQVEQDIINKEQDKQTTVILSKKLELQRLYGELQEKSLQLQTEINQLETSDSNLPQKTDELSRVNTELEETKTKIQDLGGFIQQQATEIPAGTKHQHGLDAAVGYQQILNIAYQQRDELKEAIAEYGEKERQVKKFGAGQYDVRKEVAIKKQNLRDEFAASDYFTAQLDVLKQETEEKIQKARDKMTQRARNLVGDVDPHEIEEYIKSTDLSAELTQQEEQIWAAYNESLKAKRRALLEEFDKKYLSDKNGVVSVQFKVNKNGKWVTDKAQHYDVKQDYLNDLAAKKSTRDAQLKALLPKIADIEQQKQLAMTYGNVQEAELLSNMPTVVKQFGQAIQNVAEVTHDAEEAVKDAQLSSHGEETQPQQTGDNKLVTSQGGLIGALQNVAQNSVTIDTSKLATEDTLSAIHRLLGGDGDFSTPTQEDAQGVAFSSNKKAKDPKVADVVTEASTEASKDSAPDDNTSQLLEQIAENTRKYVERGILSADEGEIYSKFLTETLTSEEERELSNEEQKILTDINAKIASIADDKVLLDSKPPVEQVVNNDTSPIKPNQSNSQSAQGGIIGVMRTQLAQESTLKTVLQTLGEIAKKNAMSGKPNSAQDLLEQFRRMLESDAWEGKERVAYMDLATGTMSNAITGDKEEISKERLRILREAYANKMDMNAQVHTHANENDPYFSQVDLQQFAEEFKRGIKQQILLSKDNMTVLDMAEVKDINGLLDALTKTEHNFEALAMTADKFGAKYINRAFNELTPQGLVKMLGIKGIESKYTETETRDSAIKGVLAEEVKEAAKVVQESTGRAVKTTRERFGPEWLTTTEKTDTKGNKTWSKQFDDSYTKAALATKKEFDALKLGEVFGEKTEAANALADYQAQFEAFSKLLVQFKQNPEQEGLQAQFNELLPKLDEAEQKLNKLIVSKDKFLGGKEAIATFTGDQLGNVGDSLKALATTQYAKDINVGDNVAFNGLSETPNGTRLLVDVLKDGIIKQYALEVDKATGQVKEFMVAENALVNAFQNVNKAMRQNEIVQADIVPTGSESEMQQFLATASSPMWDEYKTALLDMQTYTSNLWNAMKEGGSATQQELDYLMALSERVLTLGKNVQKTSINFRNLEAQNPERITALNIGTRNNDGTMVDNRDAIVRAQMENLARHQAMANRQQYDFIGFDNDTLKYTLTDAYGNVHKLTMVWNELYQKVITTNDATIASLNPVVNKLEQYKQAIIDAQNDGYLSAEDIQAFTDAEQAVTSLIYEVQRGTASFEELESARQNALNVGSNIVKTINTNKKLYIGTNEIRSVDRQHDKIIGSFGATQFNNNSDVQIIQDYQKAYDDLHKTYAQFAEDRTLYDTAHQEQLRQEAVGVQKLGRQLMASITQADKLHQLVEQSGGYTDTKGEYHELGGISAPLSKDAQNPKNLETAMRNYAQAVFGANLENVKINKTTQQLTGTLRLSNQTVADVAVQYNAAEGALFAYNKQERESLTGLPAFIQGFKAKMASIMQYIASITSFYQIFGQIKQGIQYIREIDSALTELKKVTDETEESYDRFLDTAAKTADKVGSTIKEIVSSTADWARLGYSMEDAAQLAESTSILLNVSEFSSIEDATSALTSTLQAFGYTADNAMNVVDVLNEVGKLIARR